MRRARPTAPSRCRLRPGPRSRRAAGALVLVLVAAAPAARAAEEPDRLGASLAAALRAPALRGAEVSALVVRDRDGEVLFERSPDRALTPASNQKVLTALAALSALGPTHRFETVVESDAPPDARGGVDWLRVRGGGDPVLNSEDWWRLASELARKGLRRVRGPLLLDDSAFDAVRWHPSWGRTSARAYHAPVGALTANYGAFAVHVRPGLRPGEPVAVRVSPPVPYLEVSNGARTGPPRRRSTLVVDRRADADGERVIVRGTAPAGGEERTYYRSVLDPARYAGAVLRMQLRAVGVEVEGPTRRVGAGAGPDGAAAAAPSAAGEAAGDPDALAASPGYELLRFEGRPLAEIVRLFVKYSNNAVAETLVKGLGRREGQPGTWARGAPALRAVLDEAGVDTEGLTLVDGSGLAYENRASPRALVEALRAGRRAFGYGPEFVSALPIAAADGTLEDRADGAQGRVRAKTGLLNAVTGLSGFAALPDGELAVFSVLVNGYRSGDRAAMDAVDAFVRELVRDPAATAGGQEPRRSGDAS